VPAQQPRCRHVGSVDDVVRDRSQPLGECRCARTARGLRGRRTCLGRAEAGRVDALLGGMYRRSGRRSATVERVDQDLGPADVRPQDRPLQTQPAAARRTSAGSRRSSVPVPGASRAVAGPAAEEHVQPSRARGGEKPRRSLRQMRVSRVPPAVAGAGRATRRTARGYRGPAGTSGGAGWSTAPCPIGEPHTDDVASTQVGRVDHRRMIPVALTGR